MDGDGGEGERLLVSVPTEPHEQRLLVQQPDAAGEGMDLQPRLKRRCTATGTGTSRSRPPFPRNEQGSAGRSNVTGANAHWSRAEISRGVLLMRHKLDAPATPRRKRFASGAVGPTAIG